MRFGVEAKEIFSPDQDPLPAEGLLAPGLRLFIPRQLENTTYSQKLLPDSELVYSPSDADFDIDLRVDRRAAEQLSQSLDHRLPLSLRLLSQRSRRDGG